MLFNFYLLIDTLITAIEILLFLVLILIPIAYFTLAERKILGLIQRRKGPNVVGVFGLLQPLADGLKLFLKESIVPTTSNSGLFMLSPLIPFFLSLMSWGVIPYDAHAILFDIEPAILYLMTMSSLNVYGIIISGWSSNSKYPFLGAIRSSAQMISYEVSLGFILISICFLSGSFNLREIIEFQISVWNVFMFFPLFIIFFISILAETNRHPFDLPEAEAELVSGYNVEYSAMGFALFSLGEYTSMLNMSAYTAILFFGGWLSPFNNPLVGSFWFALKVCFFVVFFIWMRAALPRYRYDQLMTLGWTAFLPLSLCYVFFVFFTMICFNSLPF